MADIREIADFSAPELDIFARLRDSQLANWECAEQGIFIAESPKVIARALQSGYEPISFLMERRHVENQTYTTKCLSEEKIFHKGRSG